MNNVDKTKLIGCDPTLAIQLQNYLSSKGVDFSKDGFPAFPSSWFLDEEPDEILPYPHRHVCRDPKRTAICFNSSDDELYVRLSRTMNDLPEYRNYLGVMPMDISVSHYMLGEVQRFNLLLNCLFLAVMGVNGIKFAAPVRFGSIETIPLFAHFRMAPILGVGSIGTRHNARRENEYEAHCRKALKLVLPKARLLLSYGEMRAEEAKEWRQLGINTRSYIDYQERSRKGDLPYVRED